MRVPVLALLMIAALQSTGVLASEPEPGRALQVPPTHPERSDVERATVALEALNFDPRSASLRADLIRRAKNHLLALENARCRMSDLDSELACLEESRDIAERLREAWDRREGGSKELARRYECEVACTTNCVEENRKEHGRNAQWIDTRECVLRRFILFVQDVSLSASDASATLSAVLELQKEFIKAEEQCRAPVRYGAGSEPPR
jgi:hypothetical protein